MNISATRLDPAILNRAVLAASGFFILAWGGIELTRQGNGISSIWPATAFGLAFLLRCNRREWPVLLLSFFIGKALASVLQGDDALKTLVTSLINAGEAYVSARIICNYTKNNFNFSRRSHLMIFAAAGILCPVPSSLLAGTYFNHFRHVDFIEAATGWYFAKSLGLIVFTPLFFIIGRNEFKNLSDEKNWFKFIFVTLLLLATLSIVFLQSSYPLLFVVFPVLALSAFWLGTTGAIVALSMTTIFSIFCTLNGLGPINLIHGGMAEKNLVLQGFLATAALISLPIASALSYRSQLEASLKEARAVAENANLAKSRFLTSMSHELRTPLNAILGFSQLMLLDQSVTPRNREHITHVMTGGEHLLKLIGDVLDLAKIEAGKISIKNETICCGMLVEEAIEIIRPLAQKRRIDIETSFMPDLFLNADRARLMQIMVNLLSNAVKYNHAGGNITVTSEVKDGQARISVTDTGHGIARALQDKVFEPFNRLGAEHSDVEGTGIGLSISKQLAEAMHGKIGFSSVEAEGSIFYIQMPIAADRRVESREEDAPIAAYDKNVARILYIEDNLANGELMRNVVENVLNANILVVRDGKSGLRQAREFAPDVIISDIHLPDMTGHQVLKSLREHPLTMKIPVMALTADATYLEHKNAKDFDRVMSKPFQLKEMVETIGNFLQPSAA